MRQIIYISIRVRAVSVFILCFALYGCNQPSTGEWIEVGKYQSDNSSFYMHSQIKAFESDIGLVAITSRFEFKNPLSNAPGESYRSVVSKLLLDCVENTASEIARLAYKGSDAKGDMYVITNRTPEEAKALLAKIDDPAIRALHFAACQKISKN